MSKVLLVEDNEMNRDMLARCLERKGFEVVTAVDGQAGVDDRIAVIGAVERRKKRVLNEKVQTPPEARAGAFINSLRLVSCTAGHG